MGMGGRDHFNIFLTKKIGSHETRPPRSPPAAFILICFSTCFLPISHIWSSVSDEVRYTESSFGLFVVGLNALFFTSFFVGANPASRRDEIS